MPASARASLRVIGVALWLATSCVGARSFAEDSNPRNEARVAYSEGHYEAALEAIDRAPPTDDLAYLRIRVLAALERYSEALDGSATPHTGWPAGVVHDLAELRSDWAAQVGRCELLEAQGRAPETRTSARRTARCAFAADDFKQVKLLLASAKDSDGLSMYIRALIQHQETEAARPLARAFYIAHPTHPQADGFHAFLEADGSKLDLTLTERLTRAEQLLEAHQPERAVDELARIHSANDKSLEPRLWHLRAEALFRTRKRYPEARKAFAHAAKLGGDTEDYDAFHTVRATSRAGQDRAAIKGYKAFAIRYPKSRLVPDAVFLAAWLSAREKLPNANKELQHFVESKYGSQAPGLRRDALWQLGFQALEKRSARKACKWLEAYEATVDRPLDRARAAYWRGRAALLARDKADARVQFRRALEAERLGYYAQLAARQLMALGDVSPPAFSASTTTLPRHPSVELPPDIRFYSELGLSADAASAANRLLGQDTDRLRRIAMLLETGEAYQVSVATEPLLERILETPPSTDNAWLWQAILPRPYLHVVTAQTAKHHLDPALFYGHMQVESHYKPRVVSSADAIGLMQLIPETATKVARGLGRTVSRDDLMQPHVNIALGAAYLGGLVAHYRGQFPLAIAAYNVGPDKVDEWLKRARDHELDRWVESIPVEQTRNYVRRVITGWSRYHALVNPTHPWALPLPKKVRLPTR